MGISPKLRHVRNFITSNLVPKLKQHALKQLKVAAANAMEDYSGEGKRRSRPHPLKFKM